MSFFVGGGSQNNGHNRGHGYGTQSSSHKSFVRPTNTRPNYARSASSIFSSGRGGPSSYYKRRPRDGYVTYLMEKLKRLVSDLWRYARRHPVKAFFAVVVPLISAGGALHGLLKQFGITLPALPAAWDGNSRSVRGGYYGSTGYGYDTGYGSGGGGGGGMMQNMGSLFKIAQAFM